MTFSYSHVKITKKSINNFLETRKDAKLNFIAKENLKTLKVNWSEIPLIYSHNDLSLNNLVINQIYPIKIKIIDWESMNENGLPAIDLITICGSVKPSKYTQNKLLKNYCSKLNFDKKILPAIKFLKLIKSREKWINENKLDRTVKWDSLEEYLTKQLLVSIRCQIAAL